MSNKNSKNKPGNQKETQKETLKNEPEVKSVKYYFKSEKELGFKKRNFHTGVGSGLITIEADKEVDEKTYNLFSSYCKEVFFKF